MTVVLLPALIVPRDTVDVLSTRTIPSGRAICAVALSAGNCVLSKGFGHVYSMRAVTEIVDPAVALPLMFGLTDQGIMAAPK